MRRIFLTVLLTALTAAGQSGGNVEIDLSVNGLIAPVTSRGWPMILWAAVVSGDGQPVQIGVQSGNWTKALSVKVVDPNGQEVHWTLQQLPASSDQVSLVGAQTANVQWLVAPQDTQAIADGTYEVTVTLDTSTTAATGQFAGSVTSSSALVQVQAEPGSLSAEDETAKLLLFSRYSRLAGKPADALNYVNSALDKHPEMMQAWSDKAILLEAAGDLSGAMAAIQKAQDLWTARFANSSTTPPPSLLDKRMADLLDKVAAQAGPSLTPGTLANGATYLSGGLVPGSWAQVKGLGLSATTRIWGNSDFTGLGNKLPTNLSGVQVNVNNLPAAIYYIDQGQVSFQVPAGVTGTASVQVINNGKTSNTVTAAVAANSPGIFPVIAGGANYAAGVFLDGKYVGDPAVASAFRKAKPGDVIQLFATGLVATPSGVVSSPQTVSGVTVTLGSVTFPADFAGLVAVGEFQINFQVPAQFATLAEGNYPISIQVNGVSSPTTINSNPPGPLVIAIQH